MTLAEFFRDADWARIAAGIALRYDVPLTPAQLAEAAERARHGGMPTWTAETWCRWFHDEVHGLGLFQGRGVDETPDFSNGPLHVFFLSLAETAEMRERLRRDDREFVYRVARSKLFGDPHPHQPIDRVAARVVS